MSHGAYGNFQESRFLGYRAVGDAAGDTFPSELRHLVSPIDGGNLEAVYDLPAITRDIDRDQPRPGRSQWRWSFLLPLLDPAHLVSMGEGATPLLPADRLGAELGVKQLYIKDESRNPTGSFKDRGSSVTVSKCVELGHKSIVVASSGNLACSLAAYSTRGGRKFYGLIRDDTTDVVRLNTLVMGQKIFVVEGGMLNGSAIARELAERFGFFHAVQPYNLFRIEGKKTLAFEIVEDLGWKVPDRVMVPTSGCTNVLALHKGFRELLEIGWIDRMPAIDVIQPSGCAPVHEAWSEKRRVEQSRGAGTTLVGLGHPMPAAGDASVAIMNETGGVGLIADDSATYDAARLIAATEGLFLQPASAIPVAALRDPRNAEHTRAVRHQTIVVIGTASGKNHIREPLAALAAPPRISKGFEELIAMDPELRQMPPCRSA